MLTTNCSQQLRPLPVPREADPADDRQRARRQAAAGLRRRPAGARLALRQRPLRARSARCSTRGRARRDLQHRRRNEKPNIEVVHTDLRACSTSCGRDADGAVRAARSRYVTDRPGHDRRYAIDAAQDRARARLAAGRDLRDRHPQDRALVPRQRRLGRAACRAAPTATGSRRNYAAARPRDEDPAARQERPGRLGAAARARAARRSGRARLRQRRPLCGRLRATRMRWRATVRAVRPDVIVNAAAHTAVDKAESEPELARAHQRDGARRAGARGARRSAPGWSTTAPTTSSTAAAARPGARTTPTGAAQRLRPHQARRRGARSAPAAAAHLILRTSWVYARARRQLRQDDAAAGRASATR